MSIDDRLQELGIRLPEPATPIAAYVSAVRCGNLVFVSGQLPRVDGRMINPGKLGQEVDIEAGHAAARACAINALAVLRSELGSLDSVTRIVRLNGFVASDAAFTDQPKVIDGASSLMLEVFGEAGRHSRVAVGVAALPLNAPVEIDLIVEVA